jgi:pimeloyl-ACP methyl ester carboxylesterase
VSLDGVRVLGRSGPAVLLLPGAAEPCDGFFPGLPEGLTEDPGCRVIVHDRPGTGTSPIDEPLAEAAAHLKTVVDELGCRPVVVVGQGLGGGVAILLARDHPETVAGLVLLGPTPINDPTGCARLERVLNAVEKLTRIRRLDRLFSCALRAARAVRGITELSAEMRESDLPRLPAVVVTADRKPTNGIRKSHAQLATAFGAALVSWPGAVHNLHLDHPDETLATVRELVGRAAVTS